MAIQDCPAEIRLAIFEHLDSSDLASLCATSKAMRQLTEPFLYSAVLFTWTEDMQPSIMLLLRSFLERPELRRYLISLTLVGKDDLLVTGWKMHTTPLMNIVAQPKSLFDAVASIGLSPSETDNWMAKVQSGSADAVVAVLVSMAPNLANLSLSPNWAFETRLLGHMFRVALYDSAEGSVSTVSSRIVHRFESLTHVSLTPWLNALCMLDPPKDIDHDILSLFYLPNIQDLSISVPNFDRFTWPYEKPPVPSALTNLELFRIRENYLEPILSVANNLERLHYDWRFHECIDRRLSERAIDLDQLGGVLGRHGHSLSVLKITARSVFCPGLGGYEQPEISIKGALTGLSQLDKIKTLQAPWVFVIDDDSEPPRRLRTILPSGLKHLAITEDLESSEMFLLDDKEVISAIKTELEGGLLSFAEGLKVIMMPPCRDDSDDLSQQCQDEVARLSERFNLELKNSPMGPNCLYEP